MRERRREEGRIHPQGHKHYMRHKGTYEVIKEQSQIQFKKKILYILNKEYAFIIKQ